ncbi:MAG: DnaJ domain-containing protein [Desulfovibrionaceae bacterium]|nr:DnaJ domain-containing protein [Desulfovibrionaceae bacterium]
MLPRKECFEILRLDPSAGPNAIKQAYRRMAFELHPDLHPDLPDAAKQFQRLNEAYVLLMREYANTSFSAGGPREATEATGEDTDEKSRAEAHKTYRQQAASGETGREARAGGERRGTREDLLRDLLNDPFARHVFEDIYSHLRYNEGKPDKPAPSPPRKPKKKRKVGVRPAGRPLLLAAGRKINAWAGGVRDWLRRQIDEEQEMFLPAEALYPGTRVRLQVRHGFADKGRVVEFNLPPEFKPGIPIRLRGLGKKLGKLEGDLYLRVLEQTEDTGEEG